MPYASTVLRTGGAVRLRVTGTFLGRPELAGAEVEVFVEEGSVGRSEVGVDGPFEASFPFPADLADRSLAGVRFAANDYVYLDVEERLCGVLRIDTIEAD